MSTPVTPCPNCGTPSSGRFCSECGAAMLGVACDSCRSPLTPGAKFCHRCGTPVGVGSLAPSATTAQLPKPAVPEQRSILPWVVAGAGALALVIMVAAQSDRGTGSGELGGQVPMGAPVRAPDISAMSPRDRADRLYDRVMRLVDEGKADSAVFFSTMAVGAYEALAPFDADLRYDYGRMAEVAGDLVLAQSQADSILLSDPNHLLGLVLSGRIAALKGDLVRQRALFDQLVAAKNSELAKNLTEYTRHLPDIEAATRTRP